MAEELTVEPRESRGKRNAKRLRKAGRIPAVLYGHGKENVALSVPAAELGALVAHGSRLVTLRGVVNESAFIRDLQWDTWGTHVLHVDFTRISAHEKVQVVVTVELRGEAPGVKEGGVVEHSIHELQIECPAGNIPEKLMVNVNALNLHDSITVEQMDLPVDTTVLGDTAGVVVQCVEPAEIPEEEAVEAAPGEPEVIGGKEEEGPAGEGA